MFGFEKKDPNFESADCDQKLNHMMDHVNDE